MKKISPPRGFTLSEDFAQELLKRGKIYHSIDKLPNFNKCGYLRGLCYIFKGAFSFQFEPYDGNRHFGGVMGRGDWFGSASLFIHEKTHYMTETISDITLIYIPEYQILNLKERGFPIFELLYFVSRELSLRVAQWLDVSLETKEDRLLFLIVEIISRIKDNEEKNITLNITQETLSKLCGLSRPKINTLLKEAEKDNYIYINRGSININIKKTYLEFKKKHFRFYNTLNNI